MKLQRLRIIDTLSAIGLAVAALVATWPARVTAGSVATVNTSVSPLPVIPIAANTTMATTIVAANIMSSSRRAPAVRYRSPDIDALQNLAPPPRIAVVDSTIADGAVSADAVPALYGIVSVDGAPRALLRLSSNDANAALFKEGDRRGAYRVVSILADRVIVISASGQRVLRMARGTARDSTSPGVPPHLPEIRTKP
ncbi:MAG: hypothetical protein M3Y64_07165 [Gemmatimonadota bacterium]|nr:hypothetical protein [Gemmatimonadota bacterium]